MIRISIPPKEPLKLQNTVVDWPKKHTPGYADSKPANAVVLSNEAMRRDSLIRKMAGECKFKVGDRVTFVSDESKEKYGELTVEGICQNYAEYGRSKWPDHDCPLIVTAFSEKLNSRLHCSHQTLKKI